MKKKEANLRKNVNYEKVFRQMFADPVVKLDKLTDDMFIANKYKWLELEKLVPPEANTGVEILQRYKPFFPLSKNEFYDTKENMKRDKLLKRNNGKTS